MAAQTSVAVDSHDGEKPQVEIVQDYQDISTPVKFENDFQHYQFLELQLLKVEVVKNETAIQHQSDTGKRLDKLFNKADKSFTAKFNRYYGKFKTKTILKYQISEFKDNLIRSPSI